jgi:hypothetical protein
MGNEKFRKGTRMAKKIGRILIGASGWTFAPWRGLRRAAACRIEVHEGHPWAPHHDLRRLVRLVRTTR